MTEQSTTLATPDQLKGRAPTDQEIEAIRQKGAAMAAYQKEVRDIRKLIEGMEWGSGSALVKGSEMSPATRHVVAEFCRITRANPMIHVDMLGGRPYLNAEYWADLINSEPSFHHYEQRDLSPSVEKAMRSRAARHRELADGLQGEERAKRLAYALDLEEEADDVALARAQWSPPEWATVIVETTIHRFMNSAPLAAIQSGEIVDFERYLIQVPECNWAGGRPKAKSKKGYEYDPDPIGNEEPAKTARTRSLRRSARKAFSAWMDEYDEQIKKAEQAIEAEWEIIREDQRSERAALPSGDEPQAAQSGGEPSAARAENGRELPVENGDDDADAAEAELDEARQRARDKFEVGCQAAGVEPADVIAEVLDGRQPENLEDYTRLNAHVGGLVDQESAEDEAGQRRLV